MFRRFGSEVTVFQGGPQILPKEDEEVAITLQRALEAEGIKIHLSARVVKASESSAKSRLLSVMANRT